MTSGTSTIIQNTWHFSSFTNPELEISFCFIGRLQGISDRGSIILSAQLSWYLGFPGFSHLLWGFLASNMTKVQLHRPTAQREMPRESTARDGSSAWHCFPLASGPGLPEGCGLKSGFTTVPHWLTSLCYQPQTFCLLLCCVSAHECFLYLHWAEALASDMPYSEGDSFMWGQESEVCWWFYLNPT